MKSNNSASGEESSTVVFETDWLASIPIFYNKKTGIASPKIHDVMPLTADLKFHPQGLFNYLDFGYSVFGQTPIEDLQFLPPASKLLRGNNGRLVVKRLSDPIERWWDYRLSEGDVIELIRERVQEWEARLPHDQEIVLPLSGGFDSRLLLWSLKDKSRVRAYTYGISSDQSLSTDVVHAKALAKHFGIYWKQIPLGDFHRFFSEWDDEFGVSAHAHGMYHFEFYSKIRQQLVGEKAFLSGIIGDAWAGSVRELNMSDAKDLVKLSYSHGLRANPERLNFSAETVLRDQFWLENSQLLTDHRYQVITSMRFKLMLLSYLLRVPALYKFKPWTPFLDIDIAMAMLNLPAERRANRQWQRDFFAKVGLDLESKKIKSAVHNSLNYQAMQRLPLPPLNVNLLSSIFGRDYINWINKNIALSTYHECQKNLLSIPKVGGLLRRIGLKDSNLEAYYAYLCLRPIEDSIKRGAK
jgi:hypothetical protein